MLATNLTYQKPDTHLRPYQWNGEMEIYNAWSKGVKNVLFVLPTGGGKTVVLADIVNKHAGASVVMAHRQELVSQISLALARQGVMHRLIAPKNIVRWVSYLHQRELKKCFIDTRALCAVAGVDTLLSWSKEGKHQQQALLRWAASVSLWITDESHHIIGGAPGRAANKWGKALELFPNARGLGVTATPCRADGKGLGRDYDGVFDSMVLGPSMRQLIDGLPDWDGVVKPFLTPYKVYCPPNDFHRENLGELSVDGDFNQKRLVAETKRSQIIGDVVKHYLHYAAGKLGITFAPDIETATDIAKRFNEAGVRAEAISSKTPDKLRVELIDRFRNRQILQLVNVDIFGEGFDLPAVEVVSMARATASFSLFCQQWGRGLRLMEGKTHAIILDHVGNLVAHNGPPDKARIWTLVRRDRKAPKSPEEMIPQRVCTSGLHPVTGEEMIGCSQPYERTFPACPYCGCIPVPAGRSSVEMVDGDLVELDEETLRAMRGDVEKVNQHPDQILQMMQRAGHDYVIAKGAANRHAERLHAQNALREAVEWWAGWERHHGRSDRESHRKFFFIFGVDVLSAQALGRAEAEALLAKVNEYNWNNWRAAV